MKFQRIGGLSLTKQNGYDPEMPGFHSPPARKGVYGFPWPLFEWFLLGSKTYSGAKTKYAKFEYYRDNTGNKIHWKDNEKQILKKHELNPFSQREYDGLLSRWTDEHGFLIKPKRIRIFNHTGNVWHHLREYAKPGQILQTKGQWYLSTVEDYQEIFKRAEHEMMKQTISWVAPYARKSGEKISFPNRHNVCLDHMEIFISEKIKE
jgi:hypothetical protein